MNPGDIPYANTDSRALSAAVRGRGGQWWNFTTGATRTPAALDVTKHSKAWTAIRSVATCSRSSLPAAATADPAACLIESLAGFQTLNPTQCFWITSASVPALLGPRRPRCGSSDLKCRSCLPAIR